VPRFVTRRESEPVPESPEQLFRLLRPKDPSVAFLWSHQADILRDYARSARDSKDVALELPTGAGKTLVGLLIGEYRRRTLRQRVAILCPTRHLARQVGDKAASYGIRASVFIGPQAQWSVADYTAYARASAIAVTTYNSVFNTNPKLNDVQTLILDDAHAAEGPIAAFWSLTADRGDRLYEAIRDLVMDFVPSAFGERLREDTVHPRDRRQIEIVGPDQLSVRASQIREALAAHATGDAEYAALTIGDHIEACVLYLSHDALLIRPFVVPSRTHRPFERASQRVYMSATLGDGGELERSVGVANIQRLPVPEGWKEHGSGRRYFIFPSAANGADETNDIVRQAIDIAGRAVVIASSSLERDAVAEHCLPAKIPTLSAKDIEDDRDALAKRKRAVLLLTRYDGMDFPDEVCRLVVLSGLPANGHLQERFLYEHLGAQRVLNERIRARIVQGAGRCTRNASDYAAVIVRGEALTMFLSQSENRVPLQPELQAEIEFGLDNSAVDEPDLIGNLRSFLDQDDDWVRADGLIEVETSTYHREPSPSSSELAAASGGEVKAWQLAWTGDLIGAATAARGVAEALEGGAGLRPYRCFWLYLAASWAKAGAANSEDRTRADAFMSDAIACGSFLSWRPRVEREPIPRSAEQPTARAEQAVEMLTHVGIRGKRFEEDAKAMIGGLEMTAATPFELALAKLGQYLGFEAERPSGQAAPDGIWRDGDVAWFIFEAKTDTDPGQSVPVSDVRQANAHREWVVTQRDWPEPGYVQTVMISPRTTVDPAAAAVAGALAHVEPRVILDVAQEVVECYRTLRVEAVGISPDELPARFTREFRERGLDTDALALRLSERGVGRMPSP
jgi:hypothetical protein